MAGTSTITLPPELADRPQKRTNGAVWVGKEGARGKLRREELVPPDKGAARPMFPSHEVRTLSFCRLRRDWHEIVRACADTTSKLRKAEAQSPHFVRRKKRKAARAKPRPEDVTAKVDASSDRTTKRSRYLPAADREQALEGAAYQCEYVAPGGRRCTERTALQIDHVKPYAKGGTHDLKNLRVLCPRHNLYSAEREFGREFVQAKIHKRRQVFS